MQKLLVFVALASLVALVLAGGGHGGYNNGHHGNSHGYGGYNYAHMHRPPGTPLPGYGPEKQREARVNHYNGLRQQSVNRVAEHYGAGTGTARYYGVPGTGVGHGGYGYGGFGHNAGYGAGYGGYNAGYGAGHRASYGAGGWFLAGK